MRQARERTGLTQAALAGRAGTRQSAVSAVETGLRDPGVATLRRLLRAAGFDLLVDLPERTGILTLGRIASDVERIVGVRTDVVPLAALRPEVRDEVLAEAVPL